MSTGKLVFALTLLLKVLAGGGFLSNYLVLLLLGLCYQPQAWAGVLIPPFKRKSESLHGDARFVTLADLKNRAAHADPARHPHRHIPRPLPVVGWRAARHRHQPHAQRQNHQ
ncbi:MAG: hypothetical protein WA777_17130 [Rhodanobacter sp.]